MEYEIKQVKLSGSFPETMWNNKYISKAAGIILDKICVRRMCNYFFLLITGRKQGLLLNLHVEGFDVLWKIH